MNLYLMVEYDTLERLDRPISGGISDGYRNEQQRHLQRDRSHHSDRGLVGVSPLLFEKRVINRRCPCWLRQGS